MVLIPLGWYFVDRQNSRRERRKELRQLIDRMIESVDEISENAMEYYLPCENGAEQKALDAWKLTLELAWLSKNLSLLKEQGVETSDCDSRFIALKVRVTGGDFQTSSPKPWSADGEEVKELLFATHKLNMSLERAFFRAYDEGATWQRVRAPVRR